MVVEVKEAAVYIRKFLLFVLKAMHSLAVTHPFVSSFALSLLLLYACFPSLLFFLFSCSPVFICTALLLGTLLCCGEPIIPDIEEDDDKVNEGAPSLNVERYVDNLLIKKDELSELDAHVDRIVASEEETVKESTPVAISEKCDALLVSSSMIEEPIIPHLQSSSLKVERSVDNLFVKEDDMSKLDAQVDRRVESEESVKDSVPDTRSEWCDVFVASSSLSEEPNKIGGQTMPYHEFEENREVLAIEQPEIQIDELNKSGEEYVLDQGFDENTQNFRKEPEAQVRISKISSGGSEGVEGLKMNISKPELNDWIDSPLSSPWQPVNMHSAASDSDSDHSESSSPDASMSDILPMLEELHPLLHSEASRYALHSTDNSDVEFSQHQDSDDNSAEQQDEHQLLEKDDTQMVVTWTADDQRNVMDLGSSDLERNRRLESLMARRRARKNQVIIFEKDLIDLHSNEMAMEELSRFHHQISPISTPRRNPFDIPHVLEESPGLPAIPSSAPSSLLSRKNPFDLWCEREDGDKVCFSESSSQPECLPFERGLLFRRNESFAPHLSFPSDFLHKKLGSSRLDHNIVAERIDLEGNDSVDLHGQPSRRNNYNLMAVQDAGSWSCGVVEEEQKEHPKQEMQEATALSVPVKEDTKFAEQYSQTYETELVDIWSKPGQGGHFVGQNASAFEEAHENIDASFDIQGETEFGSSMPDALNHEIVDNRQDELKLFSSLEKIKGYDYNLSEEVQNRRLSAGDLKASGGLRSMQTADASAICRSGEIEVDANKSDLLFSVGFPPETVDKNESELNLTEANALGVSLEHSRFSNLEFRTILEENSEDIRSEKDAMEMISYSRALEDDVGSEEAPFEIVEGKKIHDPTSSSGGPGVVSSYKNLLIEEEFNEVSVDKGISLALDHNSRFSSVEDDEYKSNHLFSVSFPPSETEDKQESVTKLIEAYAFGVGLEHTRVSNLDSRPTPKENSEDIKFENDVMEVVSYSRQLEEDIGSEEAPFGTVNGRKIHDPTSGSRGQGALSPSMDLLIEELNEHSVDQDTSLVLDHHSRFPSIEDDANKSKLLFSDSLPPLETGDKKEFVTELSEAYAFEVGLEHSRVINLELRSILEEDLEDIKFKEDAMEVVSYSRVLVDDKGSEEAPPEIVHGRRIEDPTSTNRGPGIFSLDVKLVVENEGVNEDFGDQDTSLALDHHLRFASAKDDANMSNILCCVALAPLETNDKQESVTKLSEAYASGVGLVHSQVSNLDLRPMLEENLDDTNLEEISMEVVAYSSVLEEDMGSEEATSEIVHGRSIQDPTSSSRGPGIFSPDVNLSIENVEHNEGFGDQDTSLALDHHLRFASAEDVNKFNLLFSVGLLPLETNDKQEFSKAYVSGVGLVHSQVSNLELRPTLEKNLDDSNLEEDSVEVVSYSRVHEEDLDSEEVSLENVHDSKSSSGATGVVSPNMDVLIEKVGLNEDFGDQDASWALDHHSIVTSEEDDVNKSNHLFFVGLPPSETEDKQVSVEQLTEAYSSAVGFEHSRVTTLELGPILEENVEHIKSDEEHANLVKTTLLMPEEPNVGPPTRGQQSFSFQKNSEEADNEEKEKGLVFVSAQLS